MNSKDEQLVRQCVAAMLRGESAAIDRLPRKLRATAYQRFTDDVRAGKGDPNVSFHISPTRE
jgi:hypothetical protein